MNKFKEELLELMKKHSIILTTAIYADEEEFWFEYGDHKNYTRCERLYIKEFAKQ